ncbi:MAG TPA: hypothetical protein VHU18_03550 [Rhizomicrobium sp.]|jgi:hypothetical protein|nr:hypothetical protein [Rhizomicrobium sp.]
MNKRIIVVANKCFEADPLIGVFYNSAARSLQSIQMDLGEFRNEKSGQPPKDRSPRANLTLNGVVSEIWCLQDLMDPLVPGTYSNTSEKARILPEIFDFKKGFIPSLVIAFGTAASNPQEPSQNGCVNVGSSVFVHNYYADKPEQSPSNWSDEAWSDRAISSFSAAELLSGVLGHADIVTNVQDRALSPPNLPSGNKSLQVVPDGIAVSPSM